MQRAFVHARIAVACRNDAWSVDHGELPVTVIGRHSERLHPWATVFLDEATRPIVAWALTDRTPSAEVVVATLADGLLGRELDGVFVGGKPARFRPDRGADWLGDWVTRCLVTLGVAIDPAAPYSPHQKGKVERVIKTIQEEFCRSLPGADFGAKGPGTRPIGLPDGVEEPLLTFDEFVARFREWVVRYNTERPHAALDGRTPLQAWAADPAPVTRYTDLDALRQALLRRDEARTVDKNGISFRGRLYVDAALDPLVGKRVSLGYIEERPEQIEVFDGARWVATAKWDRLLTGADRGRMLASRQSSF